MIVEAKDVRFSEIGVVETPDGRALRLRGLVFHSSLAVKDIKSSYAGDTAVIEVELAPVRKGMSGNFSIDLPLRSGVERVLFGHNQVQIWPVPSR
jgi:hypothetical protein